MIIVVDDDRAVRDSLKFCLELEGLSVKVHEGADSLLKDPILSEAACLVLDYHMPGTDGFVLRERLTARGYAMPQILITTQVSNDLRRRARNAGFFTVLEKPLLDDALVESVRAAIGN